MRRIRTIKPEWLEDEKLALASLAARVLSIGLLLIADDYGRGRANPAQLRGVVFPSDDSTEPTRKALDELASLRFVHLYELDGQRYFEVRNWTKHQKVDRPGKPLVPPPLANPRETVAKDRETLATDQDQDQDQDQDLEQRPDPALALHHPEKKASRSQPRRQIPDDWIPTPKHREKAQALGLDLDLVAEKFRAHAASVDRRCVEWGRAFDAWLLNERPPAIQKRGFIPQRADGATGIEGVSILE